jgi:hypothetical protein
MTSSTLLSHRIGESIYTILEESGDSPKLKAGKIQVAQTTYELLKDAFILEPRGIQTIKGKGQMKTWFLIGIRE